MRSSFVKAILLVVIMEGLIFSILGNGKRTPTVLLIWFMTFIRQTWGNYSVIVPFVDAVPPSAINLKQGLDWNYDLRWNNRLQWDVGHTSCWDVDFADYYSSSLHHRWESCRLTSVYLNSKLAEEKQFYKTATCCYIKCALHWAGWVNDDYSFNEARGENIARDLMKPIKSTTFSRLMEEYRKCAKMYRFPFGPNCTENLEFARCHIQAFNNMCEQNLDNRAPFPRPEPAWTKIISSHENSLSKPSNQGKESVKERPSLKATNFVLGIEKSKPVISGRSFARNIKDRLITAPQPFSQDEEKEATSTALKSTNRDSMNHKRRAPWLTTGHFCSDLCLSACSINENLYTD
ncbi:unnamed protein product [Allacma fusca]|uniref:Uncharacterized protein n=1 Tax=Allacma fusca TaxID=39272 RepID=A0A8J2PLD7_9HEXA|nr:unnamed protein product [Allacma fusca]